MPVARVSHGDVNGDRRHVGDGARADERGPKPGSSAAEAQHRRQQGRQTTRDEHSPEAGPIVRDQRHELRMGRLKDSIGGAKELHILRHKDGRRADVRNRQSRGDQHDAVDDKQELTPQAEPPAPIVMQIGSERFLTTGERGMDAEQQERKRNGRDEGMKRVEVAKTKEQEEAQIAGCGRDHDREPRPVQTATDSVDSERQIENSDGEHRAGECDPVVPHEIEQSRIDRHELQPR